MLDGMEIIETNENICTKCTNNKGNQLCNKLID